MPEYASSDLGTSWSASWDMALALGAPMTRCDVLYYTLYIYTIVCTCVSKLPIHVAGPIIVAYVDRNSIEMLRDKVSRGAQMVGLKINRFLALKISNLLPIIDISSKP